MSKVETIANKIYDDVVIEWALYVRDWSGSKDSERLMYIFEDLYADELYNLIRKKFPKLNKKQKSDVFDLIMENVFEGFK